MSYLDKIQVGSTTYDVQDSKAQTMIAPAYDATKTYAVDNCVTYGGKLYRCVSAISTAEAWTAAHWAECAAMPAVAELRTRSHNLLDAANADVVNLVCGNGATNPNNSARSVVVPVTVTTQTKLTVTKTVASARFAVATYTVYPVAYTSSVKATSNNSATSITVDINDTIKYVMVYFWLSSADTEVTVQQVLDGMMVEFGSSFGGYEPYYVPAITGQQVTDIRGTLPDDISDLQHVNQYDFASLLMGYNSYIDYDTVNGKITIPQDTLYIEYKANGSAVFKQINGSAAVELTGITYAALGTTAINLVLNVSTWAFSVVKYDVALTANQQLIACIRLKHGSYTGSIASPTPWSINGNPYGVDIIAHIYDYNRTVKSIAHRGWYTDPENTLISYKTARKMGCMYGETDIRFTSDGVPVLLHDKSINNVARNSDGTTISGTVNIGDITLAQAQTYDFGISKGAAFAGTQIATLDDFCKLCRKIGMRPYIELKRDPDYSDNQIKTIVDTVNANGLLAQTTFISFYAPFLETVKTYSPTSRLGLIVQNTLGTTEITAAQGLKLDTNEVFISSSVVGNVECAACAAARMPLEAWNIETLVGIRDANPYITGFTSGHFVAGKLLYNNGMS